MSVVFLPSWKYSCAYALLAAAFAAAMIYSIPLGAVGFLLCLRRAIVHGQRIEFTAVALVSRTPFREQQLPYREIGAMRFSRFHHDLLIETPNERLRIPANLPGHEEIRRAVSHAIWAHRGGDVPPDFTEGDTAFI